ncbi:hypothetical protein Apar_0780 [Lancefieldella parvula DSM 20469]|uniref:Uncharacterized protein n=1 Tax=Lancefieldella parvula (strain ATCC 33793 / DSM 20469 / CCUG 32760 / JCM 10300 / KCTC 3663 / VPI 0546 / 1246) TaxID=521095 RepID=C8W6W9_LANP1|nr:hypothetical protein Apar_0780 [Lancefieldella parvula DSM 20469]
MLLYRTYTVNFIIQKKFVAQKQKNISKISDKFPL